MNFFVSWLILAVSIWLTAMILPGIHVKSFGSAIIIAAIFGVVNFLLGWLFFAAFTVLTLGLAWILSFLTRWVINAIMLKITDAMTDRLTVDSFGWALGAAFVMSALGTAGEWVVRTMF